MAAIDLVSVSQVASAFLASGASGVTLSATQTAYCSTLITAASDAIQRHLGRWLAVRDYLEIKDVLQGQWDKNEPDFCTLTQFPIQVSTLNPIVTVRSGRTTAIVISNTNTTANQRAYFYLRTVGEPEFGLPRPIGITLVTWASGVQTQVSFPFFVQPSTAGFSVTATGSGGSLTPGTYLCSYSNVNAAGESIRSADIPVVINSGQYLAFTLPPLIPQAVSNNVYVSTVGGGTNTETLQNTAPITTGSFNLASIASGAAPQTVSYGTLSQLATGINTIGNGWSAIVQQPTEQFGNWASSDVWASQSAQVGALATGLMQGLDVFQDDILGVQVDPETGCIYLPQGSTQYGQGPGYIQQWPGSSDIALGGSTWKEPVLVSYAAGFTTIPYAIQEACIELVKAMFERLGTDTTLKEEKAISYSRQALDMIPYLPPAVRKALSRFKVYRI